MKQKNLWPVLDAISLCLIVATMCSQINLGDIGQDTTAEGYVTKQLKVALPDITLLLSFLWFAGRTTAMRAWKHLWWPPFACWALIAVLIIATLHSRPLVNAVAESVMEAEGLKEMLRAFITKESKEAIAKTLQFMAYFVLAPLMLVNLMHDWRGSEFISRRRLALWTFTAAVAAVAGLAWLQLLGGSDGPRGWHDSPNAYAGLIAISLPLIMARLFSDRTKAPVAIVLAVLALIVFSATLISIWAALTIFAGALLAGLLLRMPVRTLAAVGIAGVLVASLWPQQKELWPNREASLRIHSESESVKKPLIEWFVAAKRLGDFREAGFATGAGPGNYQFNIGSFYVRLPNEEKMPPDSNNLYFVQATSIGILGLGAILWILLHFCKTAAAAYRARREDWLAAGVLASLAAWLFINLFHALIVRGTGVVLAFLLALAVVAWQQTPHSDSTETA